MVKFARRAGRQHSRCDGHTKKIYILFAPLFVAFLSISLILVAIPRLSSSHDKSEFNLSFDEKQALTRKSDKESDISRPAAIPGEALNSKLSVTNTISSTRNSEVRTLESDMPWLVMKTAQFEERRLLKKGSEESSFLDVHEPPFQRYPNVVITTKVHWSKNLKQLKRMLCTFNAAYNRFVNYDVLVFTTMPWSDEEVEELARVVAPAKLIVSIDAPPLEEQLASMTKEELDFLYERCNVKDNENITWFHHCTEKDYINPANLAYAHQSEFRAYHIYNHPAMQDYKWMLWLDSDTLCSKTWESDPIQVMIENNLTVLYDNFPAGSTKGLDLKAKMTKAYGRSICGIWETDDGHWFTRGCRPEHVSWVVQIHGFHHITNLDVYRSERHQKFLQLMVSDYRFSRKWDDQLGVTIPAAFEAPERAWDLRKHNMTWMIRHNGEYDGKDAYKIKSWSKWWHTESNWTSGKLLCDDCMSNEGEKPLNLHK
jgi:hypothetical protein